MIKNILLLLAFISMPSVSFADSSLLPNEMITTSINSMNDQLGDQENKERENAREMWKKFSALNIICKYWVNKENKWVLTNSS